MDLDFTDVNPSGPPASHVPPFPSLIVPSPSQALPPPPAKQSTTPFPGASTATPLPSKFKNRGGPALSGSLGARAKSGEASMLPPAQSRRPPQSTNPLSPQSTNQQAISKPATSTLLWEKPLQSRVPEKGSTSSRPVPDMSLSRGRSGGREKGRYGDVKLQDLNDEEPAEEDPFTHSQSPVLSPSSQPTPDRFHDLAPSPHFHQQQDFSPPASQTLRFVSIAERFPGPSPHLQQADALLVSQKGSKWEECTEEEWKAGGEELIRRFGELVGKVVQVVSRKNARAAEMREVTRGYEKELEEREAKMQGTSKNMKNWAGELWAGLGK